MHRFALLALTIGSGIEACDSTRPRPPAVFVEPAKLTLEDGQTATLTARLRNPKTRTVTWSSSNRVVASVDAVGNVTGITNGTTSVVVRMTDDTTISTTVPVTVSGPAIATVTVLGDCEYSLDDSYVDIYEITLPVAGTIQVDMTSGDLDSYLGLFEAGGAFLAEDDNSGGGRNARIERQVPAGTYRVWANSLSGSVTGTYSLVVSHR